MTAAINRPPAVDRVLAWPLVQQLIADHGRALVLDGVRAALRRWRDGAISDDEALVHWLRQHLLATLAPSMRPVLNLTGTVLHTNLGRAPLPPEAVAAMNAVALGASNLEFDLASGQRGDRDDHVEQWICRLTGAEAAYICAGAASGMYLSGAACLTGTDEHAVAALPELHRHTGAEDEGRDHRQMHT